jgi:hypothetical protein
VGTQEQGELHAPPLSSRPCIFHFHIPKSTRREFGYIVPEFLRQGKVQEIAARKRVWELKTQSRSIQFVRPSESTRTLHKPFLSPPWKTPVLPLKSNLSCLTNHYCGEKFKRRGKEKYGPSCIESSWRYRVPAEFEIDVLLPSLLSPCFFLPHFTFLFLGGLVSGLRCYTQATRIF